ncbi:MFS transporter [Dactylosporangium matsuzakiense]|uniref:MFS transporter n=1 Tax=Dactylosporangium matsuzakiense TaxID=53360 RepID=UPI0035E8C24E
MTTSLTLPAAAAPARRALTGISLGYFMVLLDMTVLAVAEPDLAASLHASTAGLQWATTAYTIVFAALLLSAGAATDRYGAARLFRAGVAAFTAASLLSALAPALWVLVALRSVMGAAAAACVPASLALLTRLYPSPAARARAIATWAATSGAAVAAGPVAGGALVGAAGWRAVFLINVPIGLLVILLTRHVYSSSPAAPPAPAAPSPVTTAPFPQPPVTTTHGTAPSTQPVAAATEPVAAERLTAAATLRAATTAQPVTTTAQPVTTTAQPVVTAAQPVATVATAAQPDGTAAQPGGTAAQPVATVAEHVAVARPGPGGGPGGAEAGPGAGRRGVRPRIDWAAHSAAAAVLGFGSDTLITAGTGNRPHLVLAAALTAVAVVVFAALERRSPAPVLDRRLLRAPGVRPALAGGAAVSFALSGALFVLPLVLQRTYHLAALPTGLAFLPLTVPFAVNPPLTGRIVAKTGPAAPIAAGLALLALGAAAVAAAIHTGAGYAWLVVPLLVTGLGVSFALPALATAVVAAAPPGTAGTAAGILNALRQAGACAGVAAMGATLPAGAGWPLLLAALVTAAALAYFLLTIRSRR